MKNDNLLPKYLSEKRSMWLFLLVVLAFSILFIMIYKPIGYMRTAEFLLPWSGYIYIAIQVLTGFVILSLSRILLRRYYQKLHMEQIHFIIWIFAEIIVISFVLSFLAYLLNDSTDVFFTDLLWHVALDVASILVIPYLFTMLLFTLKDRNHQIIELRKLVDSMSPMHSSDPDSMFFYDRGGKLSFSTRRSNVLYIQAADNYSNIHYLNEGKEDTFILHNSMKNLDSSELYNALLRCHRGYMVNIDNVKLLRKDKDGLVLELNQGARAIPVSRTYNDRVVAFFTGTTT